MNILLAVSPAHKLKPRLKGFKHTWEYYPWSTKDGDIYFCHVITIFEWVVEVNKTYVRKNEDMLHVLMNNKGQ